MPRHVFLPGVAPGEVYADEAVVTKWESDGRPISSSSQPAVMAIMLEQLGVESGQRVLEIGAGTGFNAAVLAHLVGEVGAVTTIDVDKDLVAQARRNLDTAGLTRVDVVCADGADGWAESAPYDRIMLTAGSEDLARHGWSSSPRAGGWCCRCPCEERSDRLRSNGRVTIWPACRLSAVGSCRFAARSPGPARSANSARSQGRC